MTHLGFNTPGKLTFNENSLNNPQSNNYINTTKFLKGFVETINNLDVYCINLLINNLYLTKQNNGRLFILGLGGSAGNASHAASDFRKLTGMDAYAIDNVSEITAYINDYGWNKSLIKWLNFRDLNKNDCLFFLSVGGGSISKDISLNLVSACEYGLEVGSNMVAILGRDGGEIGQIINHPIIIQADNYNEYVTPYTESMQSFLLHLIVSDPKLQIRKPVW